MSLTGRVSAFFLGALALALAGSGVALYALTATYFTRRADERLTAALETLAAAAEDNPQGLEWEPNARHLSLGRDTGLDEVRWTVHDSDGRLVAGSPNLGSANLSDEQLWRSRSRRITSPRLEGVPGASSNTLRAGFYDLLIVTAAVAPQPGRAQLDQLAKALAVVGCVAWLLAAVVGRWLCRRALAPVRRMALAAGSMSAIDLDHRLEPANTADELDELGEAFNGLLGRLEEAFERQRRFTGDAAHQLSTPLTVLLGQLEVALRRDRPAADYRAAIEEAHSQAVQLRQIVELLLFLARPEADAAPPDSQVMELDRWLTDHLDHWKTRARAGDIRSEVAGCNPARAAIAPALLGQLLDNLLDNACKYSQPGTIVSVILNSSADGVVLRVEDHGDGIAAEDLPHIFEPFYRSPDARRMGKPGVGLGLAVARRIATALSGTLTAESEPGRGSRFTLRLPPT
jgi:two-component system, OmpR family, sensor kinase